ncbi:amidohydrolase family protein [Ancylobacter sonchi]|uniref:amidohydrolase family protein n=1 Tax=Ancylobacter sonchi TaxID=1937790 RepID=UPI001BD46A3A|nr:amidohydrolase family protein [Ancylobacter sonchi]MBS7537070.1 amidohydrolase family protein [Ancylobacter sonchi]
MPQPDLILKNASLRDGRRVDIAIGGGRILALEPAIVADAPSEDLGGRLVLPGFCDTHVHLDKACLLGRCGHDHGDLAAAIGAVSRLKAGFTPDDVYRRGAYCLDKAIVQGTTHMRTHVEIDPLVGLRSFEAVMALKRDYAWAVDLSVCVFPQEGLINNPGTEELLVEALEQGADLLGGCPYTDSEPHTQISRLFDLARRFDVDLDFHLDFDLDPSWMHLDEVLRQTVARGWGGRVAVGHVTKLSALPAAALDALALRLAGAGIAVTALPSTDLYLTGRTEAGNAPRGVAPVHRLAARGVCCSVATNNVMNPFTPFGDLSLLRMANLYANVCHAGPADFPAVLDLVTTGAARLMKIAGYGLHAGAAADLVVLDAMDEQQACGEIAAPIFGLKNGRRSFTRPVPRLHRPGEAALS